MQTTPTFDAIAAALAKAQGDFPSIPKTKTAKAGPYSYDYADLADMVAALQPVLAANGLSVVQDAGCDMDKDGALWVRVSTTILHASGQSITSSPLTLKVDGGKPQAVGIATTYARRYSYGAALGVSPEADTDGQDEHQTERKAPKSPPAKVTPITKPAKAAPAQRSLDERKRDLAGDLAAAGYTPEGIRVFVRETLGHDRADTAEDVALLESAVVVVRAAKAAAKAAGDDINY